MTRYKATVRGSALDYEFDLDPVYVEADSLEEAREKAVAKAEKTLGWIKDVTEVVPVPDIEHGEKE